MIKMFFMIKSYWIYGVFFIFKMLLYPYNQAYSGSLGDLTRQKTY